MQRAQLPPNCSSVSTLREIFFFTNQRHSLAHNELMCGVTWVCLATTGDIRQHWCRAALGLACQQFSMSDSHSIDGVCQDTIHDDTHSPSKVTGSLRRKPPSTA